MIAHNCITVDSDGEDFAELQNTVFDPLAPVIKVSAGKDVIAAKPGTPDATGHEVVEAGIFSIYKVGPWISHRIAL